jgi:hypothetical protein
MKSAVNPGALQAAPSPSYPLDELWLSRGVPPPAVEVMDPRLLPQPARSLLHHQTDMTSTLEKHYGESLHVEVLERRRRDHEYFRTVVLVLEKTHRRVEFGAIQINLGLFSPEGREEVLREYQPLGRILATMRMPFSSRPSAFFRLAPDGFILDALRLPGAPVLYGRRNSLYDAMDRPLAEIVEILPP